MGFKPHPPAPPVAPDGAPRVGAYVRVSSRGQDYDTQRAAIERAAGARGDDIALWFADKQSARTMRRPALDRVRAAARAGHLSRLYLFRLDRLSRSGIRDTLQVVEDLRRHGCEIVTIADGFDLAGPAADIVLAVMAWAAQLERQAIGERISAARARLEARGEPWGRPRRMTDDLVRRARALRAQGRTIRAIAIALGIPKSTVQRAVAGKPDRSS